MKVVFSYLGISNRFDQSSNVRKLIKDIVKEEKKKLGVISIIFTSNRKILEINEKFLKHSYYTDVITFSNNKRNCISGDIYISVDKVNSNAAIYKAKVHDEFIRVIIHGILHLIGYEDMNESQKFIMRNKEDTYLSMLETNDIHGSCEIEL